MNLRGLIRELDEAIFPSGIYCICCGSMIDRTRTYSLCDDCIRKFHWITGRTCGKCGKAMPDTSRGELCYDCMQENHFFRKGFSCLTYGLHERELMMDLKYAGKGYLARIFGDMMLDRLEPEIREGLSIDLVAPVPVSPGRLRERGYNQSVIMARRLCKGWADRIAENARTAGKSRQGKDLSSVLPAKGETEAEAETAAGYRQPPTCLSQLLYRTRETAKLRSLNPVERRLILRGAFAVTPRYRARLKGKTVLLVDDIYTTGATADACSQALLQAGAAAVDLISLASGGNRRPGEIA